jgi:hypothetical protein
MPRRVEREIPERYRAGAKNEALLPADFPDGEAVFPSRMPEMSDG